MLSISAVMVLELSLLALDVPVVRHRVSAEIDPFFQNFFGRLECELEIFLGDIFNKR